MGSKRSEEYGMLCSFLAFAPHQEAIDKPQLSHTLTLSQLQCECVKLAYPGGLLFKTSLPRRTVVRTNKINNACGSRDSLRIPEGHYPCGLNSECQREERPWEPFQAVDLCTPHRFQTKYGGVMGRGELREGGAHR